MDTRLRDSLAPQSLVPLGLYLHVPFCRDRCGYCSFASTTDLSLVPAYLDRLSRDIDDWGRFLGRPRLDTLYLGGGTPSLLSIEQLGTIGQTVRGAFDAADIQEATLEANPGTVDTAWLGAARRERWDRVSLGVQTLDDGLLKLLGRVHDAAQGLDSIKMCREAGFGRVSADLLLGAPGQNLSRVLDDAAKLVEAGAEHLSVYMLDLDKPCRMKAQIDAGLLALPPDEDVADAYLALREHLASMGLPAYEISNFSRPGSHSMHNVRYWQRRPYLGLGPGAASNMSDLRWTEPESVPDWIGGAGAADVQRLGPGEILAETPLLGLRMSEGVNWAALRETAETQGLGGLVRGWEEDLAPLVALGVLERDGQHLRLTPKGATLANQAFRVFV
jgi:oxygen-independent coproporphyrinogen-3 oxidase